MGKRNLFIIVCRRRHRRRGRLIREIELLPCSRGRIRAAVLAGGEEVGSRK